MKTECSRCKKNAGNLSEKLTIIGSGVCESCYKDTLEIKVRELTVCQIEQLAKATAEYHCEKLFWDSLRELFNGMFLQA